MVSSIHRVIVGTAGHIDHGKSTLVRVLTGVDPDRLKEEKDRGMTIDLGFAPYRTAAGRTVGIIDVPGHERFVKNMVAGASSVDIFLLVVAADDGVMPQTREHIEILDLLGARKGLVAVTKVDLVDPELRDLAVAEIEDYLSDTPFRNVPLVPISSATGEGIEELRRRLDALVDETEARTNEGLFRMPVQRVFSAPGHGTILTGVPTSGSVRVGDTLELLPLGARGKVRGIQAYRETRDDAAAGHSTALNLSDVDYRVAERGHVVATPGYFKPVRFIEAELRFLASASRPLKHGTDVRIHVGTSEVLARLILLDRKVLQPGEEALIQLRLRDPVVAVRGDRFLVRQTSPMITLGGGLIVSESERRLASLRESSIASVRAKADAIDDAATYLERLILEEETRPVARSRVPELMKLPKETAVATLSRLIDTGAIIDLGRDRLVHVDVLVRVQREVRAWLSRFHQENPLAPNAPALSLKGAIHADEALLQGAIAGLENEGLVVSAKGGRLRLSDFEPSLDERDRHALDAISAELRRTGAAPASNDELATITGLSEGRVRALLDLLCDRGEVVRTKDHCFHGDTIRAARETLAAVSSANGGEVIVPEVRNVLGTTRKYLIPLLEHFDSIGVTARRGDRRFYVGRAAEGGT